MFEKKNNKQEKSINEELQEEGPKPHFTRFLVGTYLHPVTGEWMIAQAHFDPVTKVIGELVSERAAGDQQVMRERLAIKQVTLGLFEPGAVTQEKKEEIY